MIVHVGMLKLVPHATDIERDAIAGGLRKLVGVVPGLEGVEVLPDAGLKEGNSDLCFVMRFADEDAWRAYGDHEAHRTLAHVHIAPMLEAKTFVQSYGDPAASA